VEWYGEVWRECVVWRSRKIYQQAPWVPQLQAHQLLLQHHIEQASAK